MYVHQELIDFYENRIGYATQCADRYDHPDVKASFQEDIRMYQDTVEILRQHRTDEDDQK